MRNNALNQYQAGHFPGDLVVPGVFIIDAAIRATRLYLIAEENLDVEPSLLEVVSTRFTAMAPLADAFTLQLSVRSHADGWSSRGIFTCVRNEPAQFASVRLHLGSGMADE